ncbi:MAG: hypothetical protein ABJA16_06240 [Nakamurella sp.]
MRDFFFRTPAEDDEPVDLARVLADDALIEALSQVPLFDEAASGRSRSVAWDPTTDVGTGDVDDDLAAFTRSVDGTDAVGDPAADAQIAALLQAWRSELDAVPLPPPLDTQIAAAIIRTAPPRRRSARPMIAVAAAIATLLMGSTAIGARSATPDDTLLWPVTQLLWGDRVEEVHASQDARKGIDNAARAIDAGHPDQAEAALEHVTVVITKVENSSERRTLMSDLGRVQAQLDSSRASTTVPPTPVSTTPVPGASTTTVNPSTPTPASLPSALPSALPSELPSPSQDQSIAPGAPSSDVVAPSSAADVTTGDPAPTEITTAPPPTSAPEATIGTEATAIATTEAVPVQVSSAQLPPLDVSPAGAVAPAANAVADQAPAN